MTKESNPLALQSPTPKRRGGGAIIILADGLADWPEEALGGRTLVEAAETPNMDRLARLGRCGLLQTVPEGFHPGSEVANSSILGYDQRLVYEGRGPLEAASQGVELGPDDLALRCNLVCIEGDLLKNHSCGRLETEEGDVLIRYLQEKLGSERVHFYTGVQYRHLLVVKGGDKRLRCTPPHDIPLHPWRDYQIAAETPEAEPTAALLRRLVIESQALLRDHPLNKERAARGMDMASSIWPWGGGYRPRMVPLTERFPQIRRGAVITAVDLIRGIGRYAGLRVIHVEGATGLWDTNYAGKAEAALDALQTDDFVYLHIEACDEAGHDGDPKLKRQCIEHIDRYIVGPIMERTSDVTIALLPDHPTPYRHRTHTAEPIPFVIYRPGEEPDSVTTFSERAAKEGAYGLLHGDQFIQQLLGFRR